MMRVILFLLFGVLVTCHPAQSDLKKEIEGELRFAELHKVESLAFKYAKINSWRHFFLVYSISESDFKVVKKHLVDVVGFEKFVVSNNGFDVHVDFPEKKAWNQNTESSVKNFSPSEHCSVFYISEPSLLVMEYFNSRG